MLKITIHNEAVLTRFELEGKLSGPWVEELKKCWQAALVAAPDDAFQIHLADVIFVDEAGKELLAALHRQRVALTAQGLVAEAVVTEIIALS
ncbi:MAG: hypothetical protein HOP19_28545 [Acidobacteria bacterium]|nr:hypothetical protein [Acidobacteriota bacterium]